MNDYFVHETAVIDEGCEIGSGTKIWHFSHIMKGARIGRNCNVGQNVVISPDVIIGENVKIQNNVSIYTGVVCEDDVVELLESGHIKAVGFDVFEMEPLPEHSKLRIYPQNFFGSHNGSNTIEGVDKTSHIAIEKMRVNNPYTFIGIRATQAQWIALTLVIAGVSLIIYSKLFHRNTKPVKLSDIV